ncbi:hypothetical protein ACIA5A_29040 [Micromonospora sp. NPDC051300]|uniref:hypothetical protein n=1 Tax=Micromonospora sp. NPDC051300 TaxID=3364286 RepID=UPI0037A2E278
MHTPDERDLDFAPIDHIRATEAGTGRWRAVADWWRDNRTARFLRDTWPLGVAALIALAVIGGLLWLLWIAVAGLLAGAGAAATAVGDAGPALGGWITDGPITRSISDPVRAYLDAHTTGLPAGGRDAWIAWLVAVCVLYAAAVTGSTYGRIGWAAIGALTGTAAYLGAPAGAGPAAAGLTALVWLTLSLLAYTATSRVSLGDVLEHLTDRRARRTATDTTY